MRKRYPEEHTEHERWAIPYGDLLTLLLCVFVVMYSLSQVNESKYRVLAESLNQAFNGTGKVIEPVAPAQPARQVPLPNKARAANATPIALIKVPVPPQRLPLPGHEGAAAKPSHGHDVQAAHGKADAKADASGNAQAANLKAMSAEIAKALQPWVASHEVVIRQSKHWLEIEIRTDILFPSGVAKLSHPARKVLDGVAHVLAHFPNPIRIEGYTDNRPIETRKFPSNWELSAARAGSVARLFSGQGVDPRRLGIFGWGQYHPIASNATPEGRNRNRRIAIVVLSDHGSPHRYSSNGGQPQMIAAMPPPDGAVQDHPDAARPAKPAATAPGGGDTGHAQTTDSGHVSTQVPLGAPPHTGP